REPVGRVRQRGERDRQFRRVVVNGVGPQVVRRRLRADEGFVGVAGDRLNQQGGARRAAVVGVEGQGEGGDGALDVGAEIAPLPCDEVDGRRRRQSEVVVGGGELPVPAGGGVVLGGPQGHPPGHREIARLAVQHVGPGGGRAAQQQRPRPQHSGQGIHFLLS